MNTFSPKQSDQICAPCTESENTEYVAFASGEVFREPEERRRGGGPKPKSVAERIAHFWGKVNRGGDTCWDWQAGTYENGYGMFNCGRFNGKCDNRQAHRIAYELTHGPIEAGLVVRHLCANKLCCNPDHLALGSQHENIHDGIKAGSYANRDMERYPESLLLEALSGPRGTIPRLARQHGLDPHLFRIAVLKARQRRQRQPQLSGAA